MLYHGQNERIQPTNQIGAHSYTVQPPYYTYLDQNEEASNRPLRLERIHIQFNQNERAWPIRSDMT